jgi:TonB-dependent SusC/RagA subfamily outer membrane receptor
MMNKKRSSPFHLLRYLLLLPIIAVVAFAVTASRGQDIQSKKSNAIVNLQKQNKDTVPLSENSKLPDDYNDFLRRNPSVKSLTWLIVPNEKGQGVNGYTKKNGKMEITKGRVGAVWVSLKNGRIEKYHFDNPDEMKKAEAKYGKFPSSWLPVPMPKPKVKYTPPKIIKDTTIKPQDKQDKGPKVKVHFTPPKIQTHTISNGNKPNTVTTFNKAYSIPTAMFVDTVPGNDSLAATLNPELDKALLIIDNKMRGIYDKVTNSAYLEKHFNPEDLSTISILKGKSAIEKYGEKGENGVIEIYTKNFVKKHPKWHPDTSATTAESKAGIIIDDRPIKSNPIYIVDGHVADSGFINQLKGKDIRSISVLKGTKAVSVYGKKAKDGAIIITTKEHAKKHRSF